jgi:ribokinase
MELGRQYGKTTIMNPAPAERLAPSIFSCIDFLTPNESELRILCGLRPDDPADTLDLAHRLQAQGVKNVIVTRGKEGALIVAAIGLVEMFPIKPVQVVDTTGSGDAFNSALAIPCRAETSGRSVLIAMSAAPVLHSPGVIPRLLP